MAERLLAGKPVAAVDLAIIRDHSGVMAPMGEAAFKTLKMRPGRTGEIVVSGDHVVTGYLDDFGRLWLMGRVPRAWTISTPSPSKPRR